jgi:predicted Zn finger-like uncharacterized protein
MRIACPSCAAEYEVPTSRLTPRKLVRCARCGGEWVAIRDASELSPDANDTLAEHDPDRTREAEGALPPMTAMDRLAASAPPPSRPARLTAAWIMTFVILAVAVAAVIAWREPIVRAWPPSGRILGSSHSVTPVPDQRPDSAAPPSSRPEKK